jgi:hypothetical protein
MIPPSVFYFQSGGFKNLGNGIFYFFENLFFQINTKRTNSLIIVLVNLIQIKNKYFQYFPNVFVAIV